MRQNDHLPPGRTNGAADQFCILAYMCGRHGRETGTVARSAGPVNARGSGATRLPAIKVDILEAGFGDLSYVNRVFHRRYGVTPSRVLGSVVGRGTDPARAPAQTDDCSC